MAKSGLSLEVKLNRIPALSRQLQTEVSRAVRETALAIEEKAKRYAPVDTGALQASIQAKVTGPFSAEIAPGTEYAEHVEYGTRHMAAQPYMTPAAEEERPLFLGRMKDLL